MDIKSMRYFISAAENLSFTKTALEQNVTQTAISLSISKMESELGFQLFTRKKRSVQLTEAGRDFYNHIVRVVKSYEDAVNHSRNTATGKIGEIRIAVPDYIMGMSLIPAFRSFKKTYSQLNVKVVRMPPHNIVSALDNHEIDAAIGFPQEFAYIPNLQHRVIRTDKLVLALSPDHSLAGMEDPLLGELNEQTFIVVHPQKAPMVDRYMYQIWEQAGLRPKKVIHADSLEDALLDVALGNAVILITEQSQHFCNPMLIYKRPKALENLNIEIALAWRDQENSILVGLIWSLLELD
ncbi:MAG TPA: LysR family transcriptional regulator [Candidatus Blautia gallistercoris]|uniref:LysR family transcriptional regulator n=1 Tax=Candidatus Blautia gallistercoris TaxID=2838490 RepID=A0A9D2B3G1_9FIRM|nr:LysR family transcriptional regulator [Candidatus Blautia gallistercoris]